MNNSIELYLSIAAICISVISLIYSVLFKKRDYDSRRAYLTPAPTPGFFDLQKKNPNYEIVLVNSGINPATKINQKVFLYDLKTKLLFEFKIAYANNPVPSKDYFRNKMDLGEASFLLATQIHFVKVKLNYYDKVLKKYFSDEFIWELNKLKKMEFIVYMNAQMNYIIH